jgi:DNA-binding NarL/FixJ family response regulator
MMTDKRRALLCRLQDESLRAFALLRTEGLTKKVIAGRLGRCRRTVARKVVFIVRSWSDEEASPS